MPQTREGFIWTPLESRSGLKTNAVVEISPFSQTEFDVIVIGAGFAGLTAARDISQQTNFSALLLEGRDRIGGRAWTAHELGQDFEMGANWVSLAQPRVYTELDRYGLQRNLVLSAAGLGEKIYFKSAAAEHAREIDDSAALFARLESVTNDFFCVDGQTSASLMPWPHDPFREPALWKQYDYLSVRDRIEQLRVTGKYDEQSLQAFEAMANGNSLSKSDRQGFVDLLTWHAYGGHNFEGMVNAMGSYKIGQGGMSSFAEKFLRDYTGAFALNSVVVGIVQDGQYVEVTLEDGRMFRAQDVVSTIPLNVLSDIKFSPPLPPLKQEAIRIGHFGRGSKIHFKASPSDGLFTTFCSPETDSPFVAAVTDAESPSENAIYGIAFGYSGATPNLEDHAGVISSIHSNIFPAPGAGPGRSVDAYITHDWVSDRFSKGTWVSHGPGFRSTYLAELQKPHGRVQFANADWADGWAGFVDGAIEQGTRAARKVIEASRR